MFNIFTFGALNPIAFRMGPLSVHWYGIIIAGAVLLALALSVAEGNKIGVVSDDIYDYILWALPVALVSARLYYVIFQWGYYQDHPSEIIAIWDGGIAIYGALIGALLTLIIFCRFRNISTWLFLDMVAPAVILAQGIGRWGNFMNQEAFGGVTSQAFLESLHLPRFIIQQMNINGFYRQPTFLYESLWDILGFVVIVLLRHRRHLFKRGEVFLTYVMWYSFGRFFIEGWRTDSLMIGNTIRVSQLLSLLVFVGGIALWIWRRRNAKDNPWYFNSLEEAK